MGHMLGILQLPAPLQRGLTSLPKLLCFLLVILIAIAAAQLVWGLYQANSQETISATNSTKPAQTKLIAPPPPRPDYGSQIARLRLMGKTEKASNVAAKTQVENAPDTSLNLTLNGVLALGDGEGFAIISDQAKKNKFYQIDSEISSGVTLAAVFSDYVLLNRAGRDEKLRLPRADRAQFTSADARPSNNGELIKTANTFAGKNKSSKAKNNDVATTISALRKQLTKNPSALKDYLVITAANDPESGDFQGYKVNPNKNSSDFFYNMGLTDNDVVVAVNNINLRDPNNAGKAIKQLSTAKQLEMTVLRNGNEETLLYNLE